METKIESIINSLTTDKAIELASEVRKSAWSPEIEEWIERYKEVGLRKDLFVLQWCHKINKDWMMLDLHDNVKPRLRNVKTLLDMYIILVDDISEEKDRNDLFAELLKITFIDRSSIRFEHLNEEDQKYLELTLDVWEFVSREIATFPNYSEYKDSFDLDMYMLVGAFKYGKYITNDKFHMNEMEYWEQFPYSMQIIIDADLDLMCSKQFDLKEQGRFRELILATQKMARIGNWLTTWEREVKAGDYTSIVVPYAIANNIISFDVLDKPEQAIIKIKESRTEEHFLKDEWQKLYDQAEEIGSSLNSVDYNKVLQKFEYLITMHLMSKGLK